MDDELNQETEFLPERRGRNPWPVIVVSMVLMAGLACLTAVLGSGIGRAADDGPQPTAVVPIRETPQPAALLPALRAQAGRIVFKSNRGGEMGVYMMDADGGNVVPASPALYEAAARLDAVAPDGDRLVAAQAVSEGYGIFVHHLDAGWVEALVLSQGSAQAPAWSPDGRVVAYAAQSGADAGLWRVNADGGAAGPLTQPRGYSDQHPSWSPDGSQLVFASDRSGRLQVWALTVEGAAAHKLSDGTADDWDPVWIKAPGTTVEGPVQEQLGLGFWMDGCTANISAAVSSGAVSDANNRQETAPITRVEVLADGQQVYDSGPISVVSYNQAVLLDLEPGAYQVQVRTWNAGQYAEQPLMRSEHAVCGAPTPTPEATADAVTPTPTWVVVTPVEEPDDVFAAATRVLRITEQARLYGAATPTPFNLATATFTPRPLVVTITPAPSNEATRVYQAARATAEAITTGTPTPVLQPVYTATFTPTPTATLLPTRTPPPTATPLPTRTPVYVTREPRTVSSASAPTPIAVMPAILKGKILFKSNRDGGEGIYVMAPNGVVMGELTDGWPYELALTVQTRVDNQFLAFVRSDFSGPQIFVHDFQYNADKQLTVMGSGASYDPAFAPDGNRIAFVSSEPGNDEIFVVNRDGSGLKRLTKNTWEWDKGPTWSPDGSQILFWSNRDGLKQLYLSSSDGSSIRLLSDGTADDWDPVWVR